MLNRVEGASEETIESQEKEQIALAWNALIMDKTTGKIDSNINGDFYAEKLEEELNRNQNNVEVEYDENSNTFSICFLNTQHVHLVNNTENIVANSNSIPISSSNLYAYYDSSNYLDGSSEWINEVGNYANINIIGNGIIQGDGGLNINRKSNNTYASIDISDKSDSSITVYIVAKAVEKNSENARLLEIPKSSSSGNTPSIFVTGSNTIGYSVFLNDKDSSVSALDYNIIVVRLKKNDNTSSGVMSTFVNNKKYIDLNYNARGDTIYLSNCAYNSGGYGNNVYKMLAVYDTDQSDEEIFANINSLKTKYSMEFSIINSLVYSSIQFGNANLAFDKDKTSTSPNNAITFSANEKDSFVGCTYLEKIVPYKYDITIMGYGTAKDYSVILQGQNDDETWENIGDEHILTTKGNGTASYGENIDYSFNVSTSKKYRGLRIINNYSNSGNGEECWHKYGNYAMRITEVKFYYNN